MVNAIGENELLKASLNGSREAFGAVVERYQALVCAITYSATGDIGTSEELAQETFIRAWRNLWQLEDAARFRSWLCTIARNLAGTWARGRSKDAIDRAEPLDVAEIVPSAAPGPGQEAIDKERREIVWAAVRRIPQKYREPLVLFYRRQQSVTEVAADLGLSEPVVRQRLHRGRQLVKAQIASLVEDTLTHSGPSKAFAVAVVAALPALSTSTASAAVVSVATKGAPAAKMLAAAGLVYAIFGAIIGLLGDVLLGDVLGLRLSIMDGGSPRERRIKIRLSVLWLLLFLILLGVLVLATVRLIPMWALGLYLPVYFILQVALILWAKAHQRRRQLEEGTEHLPAHVNRGLLYGAVGGGIFGATGSLLVQAWLAKDWVSFGAILACDILIFLVATQLYIRLRRWS